MAGVDRQAAARAVEDGERPLGAHGGDLGEIERLADEIVRDRRAAVLDLEVELGAALARVEVQRAPRPRAIIHSARRARTTPYVSAVIVGARFDVAS